MTETKAQLNEANATDARSVVNPTVLLILVHGTWGRGFLFPKTRSRWPRWFDDGSAFRSRLECLLREKGEIPRFETLFWSGANSLKAREQAAACLAKQIEFASIAHPTARRVIIGHSHGGNVILRSIAHLSKQSSVPSIVTIATPFVSVENSTRPLWSEIFSIGGAIYSLFYLIVLTYNWLDLWKWIGKGIYYFEDGAFDWRVRLLFLFPALGSIWLYSIKMPNLLLRFFFSSDDPTEISSHRPYIERSPSTLVLRAIDDEASLVLSLGAVITRLTRIFTKTFSALILIGFPFVILAHLLYFLPFFTTWSDAYFHSACIHTIYYENPAFSVDTIASIRSEYPRECMRDLLYLTQIVFPIMLTVGLLTLASGLSVFGKEMFRHAFFYEVNSSSAPDGGQNITIRTISPFEEKGGLRHMLYNTEDCVREIAEWIKK